MLKSIFKTAAAGMAAIAVVGLKAHAQSADALIEKLVDKGILTEKEAVDLRSESDKDFTTAFQTKTGMPDWVTGYKFGGDFKGRFEEINSRNDQFDSYDRFRYRLRVGVTVSMVGNFETGFRLGSGNPMANPGGVIVGGSSVSQSQDVNSLEDANYLWIDAAYGKWTPVNNGDWTFSMVMGKMDNPFQLDNMVWDYDINPAGGAFVLQRTINDKQSLKGIGAFYVLDEFNQGYPVSSANLPPNFAQQYPVHPSRDPYVYGGQILWESKWTPKVESSLSLAVFDIVNKDSLSTYLQPVYNIGNTRNNGGFLVYNYNPIIVSGSLTYNLSTFPFYDGMFPLKASGEYMNNPGAPDNNIGYRFGFTLGKAGTKKTWQILYRYQELQADSWYDALVDDDNGAFYAATGYVPASATGTGSASGTAAGQLAWANSLGKTINGWYGGTNVRGHLVQATYSFTDFLDLSVTYYLNNLILGTPGESSDAQHFMIDMMWKF